MVVSIVGALAITGTIVTFYSTLATSADLEKAKTEIKTEFQKSMQLERDISRLNNVNDSLMKAKLQQRTYPKDKDIKEDVESLKVEKATIQERIEKRN